MAWSGQRAVGLGLARQTDRFGHPAIAVGGFADQFDQLRNVERLEQIIVAQPSSLHRGFGGAKRGDQNDADGAWPRAVDGRVPVRSGRQLQIGDDEIERVFNGAASVIAALFDGNS